MKLAFFDAKNYDVASFDKATAGRDITVKYFETHLTEDTVELCRGFDAVCVFVNDSVTAKVIDAMYSYGIRTLVLRCAGYNNVDVRHAFGKIHVDEKLFSALVRARNIGADVKNVAFQQKDQFGGRFKCRRKTVLIANGGDDGIVREVDHEITLRQR